MEILCAMNSDYNNNYRMMIVCLFFLRAFARLSFSRLFLGLEWRAAASAVSTNGRRIGEPIVLPKICVIIGLRSVREQLECDSAASVAAADAFRAPVIDSARAERLARGGPLRKPIKNRSECGRRPLSEFDGRSRAAVPLI